MLICPCPFAEQELTPPRADDPPHVQAVAAQPAKTGSLLEIGPIVHDDVMFMSEAVTRGVRVSVVSEYSADQSQPQNNKWFFLYTITIKNESADTVQLMSRHWIITNAENTIEEVRGPGVVGEQPILKPGESFTYTSGCPLRTAFGTMEGTYQMVTKDGEFFDARVAAFTLSEAYTVH